MELVGATLDELLRALYPSLLAAKEVEPPPGKGPNRELLGVVLRLQDPRARLSRSMRRGRPFSGIGELAWYLAGSDETAFIASYIPRYVSLDIEGRVPSAYGPRLFGEDLNNQIPNVIELLRAHPSSRRGVVQIFDRSDLPGHPAEVPCTCTLQFLSREGKLDLIAHMRSNDAYIGLPHDLFAFTMIQELVACSLGLELGSYIHVANSMHLYLDDAKRAQEYLDEGLQSAESMPPMPIGDPWADVGRFLKYEASARDRTARPSDWAKDYWADLAVVCTARMTDDQQAILDLRQQLSDDYFKLYLTERAYHLEDSEDGEAA